MQRFLGIGSTSLSPYCLFGVAHESLSLERSLQPSSALLSLPALSSRPLLIPTTFWFSLRTTTFPMQTSHSALSIPFHDLPTIPAAQVFVKSTH